MYTVELGRDDLPLHIFTKEFHVNSFHVEHTTEYGNEKLDGSHFRGNFAVLLAKSDKEFNFLSQSKMEKSWWFFE